jgi:hypothetical protein
MKNGFIIGLLMGTAGSMFLLQNDKLQKSIKNMKR